MLKAPFPYFGGKSKIGPLIWQRFGKLRHYIEPFAGSLAVYLSCPPDQRPQVVTVNDMDGLITNFWRAVKGYPEDVARHAVRPRSEIDMIACHAEIQRRREGLTLSLMRDPLYCDPELAGWWAWGMSTAVGNRWLEVMEDPEPFRAALPKLETGGVHSDYPGGLQQWLQDLAAHLSEARVLCGDWSRAVTEGLLEYRNWDTGIFLDPPYKGEKRRKGIYSYDVAGDDLHAEITKFCLDKGTDHKIAICGYEGDFDLPQTWECLTWKAVGGYSHKGGQGEQNAGRERIWFSPACAKPEIQTLF